MNVSDLVDEPLNGQGQSTFQVLLWFALLVF